MIIEYLFQCKFVYICCLFRVVHLSSYTCFSVKQSPTESFVKYLNIIDLLIFYFLQGIYGPSVSQNTFL